MKNNKFNKLIAWSLIAGLTLEAAPVWALTKDETIYAKLNNDGSQNKIIVSEHLHNNGESILNDKTKLNDITNLNGNETFKTNEKNIVWETDGNDIYYQGTTKEQMPLNLTIKYYLNNEEKNVNDIIGEKGQIKIVLKYENNLKHNVKINGQYTTLYTPFVVATTTIIPNENNKNLSITNGKVIDNGQNSVVVGLSSPGLYESLKINSLKDMDEVVITYDTDCFELSSIYSVATSKLIEEDDFKIFDDLNSLYSSIDKLSNSSKELVKGTDTLVDGASKLKDGSNELKNGINNALNGSKTINESVKQSINALANNNAPALDDATLSYIIKTAQNSAKLGEEELKQIAVRATMTVKDSKEYKQIESEYNKYLALANNIKLAYEQEVAKGNTDAATAYQEQLTLATNMATTYKTMMTLMEQTASATARNTASQIATIVAGSVSESVATTVASSAKEKFTNEVVSSLTTLSAGLDTLNNGLIKLNEGAKVLYDGTDTLSAGVKTLNEGMKEFDKSGIEKISSLVNNDVKNLDAKLQKLAKLSEEYKTFDEINEKDEGSSKIIMIVDAIKKEKSNLINNTKITEENKSFWQKVKGLFTK